MATLKAKNVDFLLENNILGQTEIGMASGNMSAVTPLYVLKKLRAILPQSYLVPAGIKAMRGIRHLKKITTSMPAAFNAARVEKWRKLYESI